MARTALVNAELKNGVTQLTRQWRELNSAYENFARKKIEFAQEIARIWGNAQELDKESDSDANQNHFREQLREIIQSDNKSILSKWVGIGSRAQELLPFANSLPPQRDSLYALSTAVDKKKPIQKRAGINFFFINWPFLYQKFSVYIHIFLFLTIIILILEQILIKTIKINIF